MRICVLGNSHVGALKRGWDVIGARHPGVQLVFFASQGRTMSKLATDGTDLYAPDEELAKRIAFTSGGRTRVVVQEFDAFLVYALNFRLPLLDRRLSSAVVQATVQDRFKSTLNAAITGMLQDLTDAPVFVGHHPLPATEMPPDELRSVWPYPTVMDAHQRAHGPRLQFIAQPPETLQGDWGTLPRLTQGSVRLQTDPRRKDIAHEAEDVEHMNGEFGEAWLEAFLALVAVPARRLEPSLTQV